MRGTSALLYTGVALLITSGLAIWGLSAGWGIRALVAWAAILGVAGGLTWLLAASMGPRRRGQPPLPRASDPLGPGSLRG